MNLTLKMTSIDTAYQNDSHNQQQSFSGLHDQPNTNINSPGFSRTFTVIITFGLNFHMDNLNFAEDV